jgi:hypothetical protein
VRRREEIKSGNADNRSKAAKNPKICIELTALWASGDAARCSRDSQVSWGEPW